MSNIPPTITLEAAFHYELRSSPWACGVSWPWLQTAVAHYVAWKAKRKHRRYARSLQIARFCESGDIAGLANFYLAELKK